MKKGKRTLFEKGFFPIRADELCALIGEKASLADLDGGTLLSCLSYADAFPALQKGFLQITGANDDDYIRRRMSEGAAAVLSDHAIEGVPCIVTPDMNAAVFAIARRMYEDIAVPAVLVTGSVGKTTTKQMIRCVLESRQQVFCTDENHNMLKSLCCFLQDVRVGDRTFVWEVCENLPRITSFSSRILRPDIAVITNIGESHLGTIRGGKAALLRSFLGMTAGMDETGIVILNADDPESMKAGFDKTILTVGIRDESADCLASHIVSTPDGTEFDLCFRGETSHVSLSVFGEHNVYNAMMAFVAGLLRGVDRDAALKALKSFRSVGIRQNVLRAGGVVIYADCYNASAASVAAALRCFDELPGLRGKRVAVLGDIAEIKGYEEKTYRDIAGAVDRSKVEILLTYGKQSAMIRDSVGRALDMRHFSSAGELNRCLRELDRAGKNAYLFKGSRTMALEESIKAVFPAHYYRMKLAEKLKKLVSRNA